MTLPEKDPRVYFAAERTLLAWVRTGLAMMGFGFVVARFGLFLREIQYAAAGVPVHSSVFSLWTGIAFVLSGVIVNAASTAQYLRIIRDLNQGRDVTSRPSSLAVAVAGVLSMAGVAMAVYLLIVR